VEISCALAPLSTTPGEVQLAERLGYRRAWLYDSPAVYPDVWLTLGQCVEHTSRIGLGPAVLVPSLRHPMVNAAAIAGLAQRAPGRVAVAIGAGFSGRMALGERAMRWSEVADYIKVLKALLRGEDVEWNGATIRMLHPSGFGAARPIDVPILVGADGPKGVAVASEQGDGIFSIALPQPDAPTFTSWRAILTFGTVFDDGEDLASFWQSTWRRCPYMSTRALRGAGSGVAVLRARAERQMNVKVRQFQAASRTEGQTYGSPGAIQGSLDGVADGGRATGSRWVLGLVRHNDRSQYAATSAYSAGSARRALAQSWRPPPCRHDAWASRHHCGMGLRAKPPGPRLGVHHHRRQSQFHCHVRSTRDPCL